MHFIIDCSRQRFSNVSELPMAIDGNSILRFINNDIEKLPLYKDDIGYATLRELYLANNQLIQLSSDRLPPNLTHLEVSSNRLTHLSTQQLPGTLKYLDFRSNFITVLQLEQIHNHLAYLDISKNKLQTLGEDWQRYLSSQQHLSPIQLKISHNEWQCDCLNKQYLQFISDIAVSISDLAYTYCSDRSLGRLSEVQFSDICTTTFEILSIVFGTLGLTSATGFSMVFFKKHILFWMYRNNLCVCCVNYKELEAKKLYDGFIAYPAVDSELLPEFVDRLENEPHNYRMCIYERDWPVGSVIPDCICNSINNSKRTIILLTKHFLNSNWGRLELRAGIRASSQDRTMRLIIVMYPGVDTDNLDSELGTYLKFTIHLKREDPNFWHKLLYAMPHAKGENLNAELV
ncbi:protein toll-like [Scaptodrosophila lebanonensis]|uniref:Protein toll-like n=1 Tax=Drosophila lebanonensis TaxID=7225 RepID=A0A6J2TGF3_DROLE|nr:protein toll-like [Scaptodrosophila lebanonensis]